MSVFGKNLRVEIFGESHGKTVGVKIDGLKNGKIDIAQLQSFCDLRKPKKDGISTLRSESDRIIFDSGIDKVGNFTGESIIAHIENKDIILYEKNNIPRPGHSDYPAFVKYGFIPSGGGKFSGRMTAPLCIAGGIAIQLLKQKNISIDGHILSLHGIYDERFDCVSGEKDEIYKKEFPVKNSAIEAKMKNEIISAAQNGNSVGGIVECIIQGINIGAGGALFDGLDGRIASAVFAVPGVKGIEFGAGFSVAELSGTENNDGFFFENGKVVTKTNNCGGVLGGMASGMPLVFSVALKPTPSVNSEQNSVDLIKGENVKLSVKGRHDPCIVKRALPAVVSAAALAVLDVLEDK